MIFFVQTGIFTDYWNSLYLCMSKSSITHLQLVENAASKFLKGQRKFNHVTPILKLLHWLPVHLRIEFKFLLYVFKSINNLALNYLSDQLYPYNPTRNLGSGDQRLLSVPRSWLKHRGDRAFAVAGPRLWNSLPAYIRLAQSLTVLNHLLKPIYFLWLLTHCEFMVWNSGLSCVLCFCLFSTFVSRACCFLNVLHK